MGAGARWTFAAQPGTTITRLRYFRLLKKIDDNDWLPYGELADGTRFDTCGIRVGEVGCGWGENEWPDTGDEHTAFRDLDHLSTPSISFGLECRAGLGSTCQNGLTIFKATVSIYEALLTIEDPTPPAIPAATGAGWTASGWVGGTVPISVDAADGQSGIRETRLVVDGQVRSTLAGSCDWSLARPCGDVDDAVHRLDTTTLADGPHAVEVVAVDAGGEERRLSRPAPLLVDNHAPAAPVGLRAVRRGTSDVFDTSWVLPADTGSPVVEAWYRVCQPACGPATRAGTLTSAGGISLAGGGDGTLVVWLRDAAGRESPDHASARIPLAHLDASTPGSGATASPPASPSGTPPPPPAAGPSPGGPARTTGPNPSIARPARAALRIATVAWTGRTLRVAGTIARAATGTIRVSVTARTAGRRRTISGTARIRRGRWSVTLRVPRALGAARRVDVVARYAGTRTIRAAVVARRGVRNRRGR